MKFRLTRGGTPAAEVEPSALVRALGHFASELLGSSAASTLALPAAGEHGSSRPHLPGVPRGVANLVGRAVTSESTFTTGSEFADALSQAVVNV